MIFFFKDGEVKERETHISYAPAHHAINFGEGEEIDYVAILQAVMLQTIIHEVPTREWSKISFMR